MFLKPKPGLHVPYPASPKVLPAEGAEVAPNDYWQRRLTDGDVVQAAAPAKAAKVPVKK